MLRDQRDYTQLHIKLLENILFLFITYTGDFCTYLYAIDFILLIMAKMVHDCIQLYKVILALDHCRIMCQ